MRLQKSPCAELNGRKWLEGCQIRAEALLVNVVSRDARRRIYLYGNEIERSLLAPLTNVLSSAFAITCLILLPGSLVLIRPRHRRLPSRKQHGESNQSPGLAP